MNRLESDCRFSCLALLTTSAAAQRGTPRLADEATGRAIIDGLARRRVLHDQAHSCERHLRAVRMTDGRFFIGSVSAP